MWRVFLVLPILGPNAARQGSGLQPLFALGSLIWELRLRAASGKMPQAYSNPTGHSPLRTLARESREKVQVCRVRALPRDGRARSMGTDSSRNKSAKFRMLTRNIGKHVASRSSFQKLRNLTLAVSLGQPVLRLTRGFASRRVWLLGKALVARRGVLKPHFCVAAA